MHFQTARSRIALGKDRHGGHFHDRASQGGHKGNVEFNRKPAHHVPVANRATADGRDVDDELHAAFAHDVQSIGVLRFGDPVDGRHGKASTTDAIGRSGCGVEVVPEFDEIPSKVNDLGLVLVAHSQVHATAVGNRNFRGQAGLEVSHRRVLIRAKHLAGALHLRAWRGIEASELDEGENGSLDADVAGDALGDVLLSEGLADGHVGRDASEREAGRLGHEGNRP